MNCTSMSDDIYDVGEIVKRQGECFWIFPRYILDKGRHMYSPWFSSLGEKWRLISVPSNMKEFYLWRKSSSTQLKHRYTLQISLKTGNNTFNSEIEEIDSDYGCTCRFTKYNTRSGVIFVQNGLIKLYFNIKKHETVLLNTFQVIPWRIISDSNNEGSIEDEESCKDKESCKDDASSEDDTSSEEEENNEDDESSKDAEISDDECSSKKKTILLATKGIKRLAQNLKQMFLDGQMCDAVLKVENREFSIHKAILVARSPVFASMFLHDFAEKENNVADIPDCTAESFEVFLHYLYSGSANTMSTNNVYDLYYAADKYGVDDLKEDCVQFMKKNLSVESFSDVIALSLRHGEFELQKIATRFFGENIKKIIKTVQWQKYMAKNSTQANELFIKALKA